MMKTTDGCEHCRLQEAVAHILLYYLYYPRYLHQILEKCWKEFRSSVQTGTSNERKDLIHEILMMIYWSQTLGINVRFVWVPARVRVEGNELTDKYAK